MIIRVKKGQDPYARIDKVPINDKRLTWKARGVLLYLLSKPNDWRVIIADLINQSPQGERALRSGLKELLEAGYMTRKPIRENGQIASMEYTVYERPRNTLFSENVDVENVDVENQARLMNEEALTTEEATNKTGSGKPTNPRKSQKFPKEDYTAVTEAYKQIKQVEPQGNEWRPIQQTIKSMFMDGRTVDQITGFMQALEDSPLDWTSQWTIRTVRMKLPEWVAGKLDLSGNTSRQREMQEGMEAAAEFAFGGGVR